MSQSTPIQDSSPRRKSSWKIVLLGVTSVVLLCGAYVLHLHVRYREQMKHIAAIERLGGSVNMTSTAPEWLHRLKPDALVMFGPPSPTPIGPNWLREHLPVQLILAYFDVVDDVELDQGPGLHMLSNYSGEGREVQPFWSCMDDDQATCHVTADDLLHIASFPNLKTLRLRHMPLTDEVFDQFRNLQHVEHMALSFTKVTDRSLSRIAALDELTNLRLAGTAISDAGVTQLSRLKKLEYLDLQATNVSEAAIRALTSRSGIQVIPPSGPGGLSLLISY